MKFLTEVKSLDNAILLNPKGKHKIEDGVYEVELVKYDNKTKAQRRSLAQNSYMWRIINQICLKEDKSYKHNYDTYNNILQSCGTPYEDFYIDSNALDAFKKRYPHVKEVGRYIINNKEFVYVWAFKGLSEMNTKEATMLIDAVKDYASKVGVKFDEDYWEQLWKMKLS